ncbi:MAG: type II secretion system GspH family protein [Puniceicoccales bacterium]|nr:type II secretion system GspH family protein [Puniceicoccales bacterium]
MKKERGFTLIELIVVISIIGVLMGFILPSISGVIERSRRSAAQNCLKKIADAYLMYREDKGSFVQSDGISPINTIKEFALTLAREGLLNDPNSYVFASDALAQSVNKAKRNTIVHGDGVTETDCWTSDSHADGFSVNIIVDLPDSCQPNTTPIAYTRGLETNGRWSDTRGVFRKKGGFIAFLDGKVKWFDNVENKLMRADITNTTSNLRDTIPSDARIIGGAGVVEVL